MQDKENAESAAYLMGVLSRRVCVRICSELTDERVSDPTQWTARLVVTFRSTYGYAPDQPEKLEQEIDWQLNKEGGDDPLHMDAMQMQRAASKIGDLLHAEGIKLPPHKIYRIIERETRNMRSERGIASTIPH